MFVAMMMTVALAASPMPQHPTAPLELAPGARYDPAVPTIKAVLGHNVGDAISTPDQIVTYLKALSAAAPDRTRLIEYGRTWEDRPLYVLVIGAPARLVRLDDVKSDLRRLADPRGLAPVDADRLVTTLPVVVWLMHAVHGNETTSSDAALAEAYHVLAAQGDARVETILRETLLLIDPLQNPDGRARFIATNQQGRAAVPDPEPASAEHDEAWPGGRPNHYLFDMNRDWLAQSQVETRGRVRLGLEWNPHVVADLHEMGGESTYYFAPPAEPSNPYITPTQRAWLTTFGHENAKQFDARGFAYFVREVFDAFYPGYGDSWPMFQGAIAMTYEQASPRGLAYRRLDDTVLTYRDGIVHHFTAALTTMVTAAQNREKILRDYLDYRRSAVADGERAPVREYLVPPGTDRARVQVFARLLVDHGIEVQRADQALTVGARTLPAGTFVIAAAQPMFRLLRNLMEPDIRMDDVFLTEQARRRKKRLGDQIYDVTAWSLPLLFDVDVVTTDRPTGAKTTPFGRATVTPPAPLAAARAAYLIPWGSGAAGAVAQALQSGVRVYSAGRPFTIAGRKYDVGTAIVRVAENTPDLATRLGEMGARWGAEVVALDSTWVDEGMSLGSDAASLLKTPKVLLAWDEPTSSQSAGWARYAMERQFELPVTAVRASSIRRVDLRRFSVVVLPSGSYGAFGADDVRRLKDWVSSGGVLVTMAESSRWASGDGVGLLAAKAESRDGQTSSGSTRKDDKPSDTDKKPDADKEAASDQKREGATKVAGDEKPGVDADKKDTDKKDLEKKSFDYEKAIQPEKEEPESVPGALLRVTLDREHWLASGLDDEIQVVVEGSRVFAPVKLDKGRNVGIYAKKERLVAGGYAWDASRNQLPQKAYVIDQPLGRGRVIAFAEDPNFRALAHASGLLFINAVVLGPGR